MSRCITRIQPRARCAHSAVPSRGPVKRAYPFSTHQYGYITSSVAPTPVIPKTATAVASPVDGRSSRRPDARSEAVNGLAGQQDGRRTDGQECKQTHLDEGESLNPVVAATEEQRQRHRETDAGPHIHRNGRDQRVEHLRHAAVHPADLQQRQDDRHRPRPDEPSKDRPRSRHRVEPFQAGVAGRNRVAAEFGLDGGFDRAAQKNDPEQ